MANLKVLSPFTTEVIKTVRAIPRGRVATYGQIAELAGKPGAARAINWILSSCGRGYRLPWQRVIGAGGVIKFPKGSVNFRLQVRMLRQEGVPCRDGNIDMAKYGWRRKRSPPKGKVLPKMFG